MCLGNLVQKHDKLRNPHDNDTSKTKRTSASRSEILPLRAWPSRGGHHAPVPEILGIDKYSYDVGVRLAARAETKFSQQLAEDLQRNRLLEVPGGVTRRDLEDSRGQAQDTAGECFVEAGRKGSAVILWNRSGQSTDGGLAPLRKRRQKLTDDMLKAVVVSYDEPLKVVTSWFSVFQFYSDRPVDAPIPPVPQAQDNAMIEDIAPNRRQSLIRRRASSFDVFGRPRQATPTTTEQRLTRPRLRQNAEVMHVARAQFNDTLWQRRSKELCKFRLSKSVKRPSMQSMGDLNLERRCRVECLDEEKLEGWLKGYDDARICPEIIDPGSWESKVDEDFKFKGRSRLSRIFNNHRQASDCSARSQSSDDGNGSSAVASGVSDAGEDTGLDTELTTRELMLRTVSKSLLKSKLVQKLQTSKQENVQQSISEVSATRAHILASISPVHMTADNLIRSLSLFGLARRSTGKQIYEFLLQSCARSQSKSGGGLCFEAYFKLMRSLLGNKFKSAQPLGRPKLGKAGAHARPNPLEQPASIDKVTWTSSDLLLRLMFSLLSGQSACRAEHAATRQSLDEVGVPLSVSALSDALRLFLSQPVLLAVDRGSKSHGADQSSSNSHDERQLEDEAVSILYENNSSSASAVSNTNAVHGKQSIEDGIFLVLEKPSERRPASTQFGIFIECLHSELMQSQAEVSQALDEFVNTSAPCSLCFRGFEHWVFKRPSMYAALMQLLLPLLPYGVALTSEEVELAARGLSQRCGELRANSDAKALGLQRKLMAQLCLDFNGDKSSSHEAHPVCQHISEAHF